MKLTPFVAAMDLGTNYKALREEVRNTPPDRRGGFLSERGLASLASLRFYIETLYAENVISDALYCSLWAKLDFQEAALRDIIAEPLIHNSPAKRYNNDSCLEASSKAQGAHSQEPD